MNSRRCTEFDRWLERLPRAVLSPQHQEHLDECPFCRDRLAELVPVVERLNQPQSLEQVDEEQLQEIARKTRQQLVSQQNKKLAVKLSTVALLCSPIIVLVNWFWASLGYTFLSSYVSLSIAHVYLVFFLLTTSIISGLSYSSIPILVGWFRGISREEIE